MERICTTAASHEHRTVDVNYAFGYRTGRTMNSFETTMGGLPENLAAPSTLH